MRSGQLRSQVTYQEPSEVSSNPDGSPVTTWLTVGTFRAWLRSATGREVIQAQQLQAQLSLVVNHRYQGYLPKPSGRYLAGGRILDISWVDNLDNRNREIKSFVNESPPV